MLYNPDTCLYLGSVHMSSKNINDANKELVKKNGLYSHKQHPIKVNYEDQLFELITLLSDKKYIIGCDANHNFNVINGSCFPSIGEVYPTTDKERTEMQSQIKKVNKRDTGVKDHIITSGELLSKSVGSYGLLPNENWPFDHNDVRVSIYSDLPITDTRGSLT